MNKEGIFFTCAVLLLVAVVLYCMLLAQGAAVPAGTGAAASTRDTTRTADTGFQTIEQTDGDEVAVNVTTVPNNTTEDNKKQSDPAVSVEKEDHRPVKSMEEELTEGTIENTEAPQEETKPTDEPTPTQPATDPDGYQNAVVRP